MSLTKSHKFILSGGGTGGHIYPAIAIANEIKRREPKAQFLFVGAKHKMEMQKVPAAGFPIKGLWISGLSRKFSFDLFLFPLKLITALYKSKQIISNFNPDMAIGTGGFASGPLLFVASRMSVPTLLQEQNAYPGITNKKLAKTAQVVCVAYQGLEKIFSAKKVINTGNPVRLELFESVPTKDEALTFFGLDKQKKTILSIGGSLGSRNKNKAWESQIGKLKNNNVQLLWQTGATDFERLKNNSELKADNIKIVEFINDMKMAYAAADVIVSRAGAIAISELCIVGKPVILMPLPWAAEDHQTKNARALVKEKAAIMIKDADANQELVPSVLQLLENDQRCKQMSRDIKKLAKPDATKRIVDQVFSILEQQK